MDSSKFLHLADKKAQFSGRDVNIVRLELWTDITERCQGARRHKKHQERLPYFLGSCLDLSLDIKWLPRNLARG